MYKLIHIKPNNVQPCVPSQAEVKLFNLLPDVINFEKNVII